MVYLDARKWLKRAWHFMVSPPPRLDPTAIYPLRPRYAALWTVAALILEWYYFFVQVPYDTIPDIQLFWIAFLGWAMPGIIVEWVYRNLPTKNLINKYANAMIAIGVVAIALGIEVRRSAQVLPVAYALIPGFIAGAAIGSDSLLVWRLVKRSELGGSSDDSSRA